MADFRAELDDAVANLDGHYAELKDAARDRLGSMFNGSDYPETLVGLFGVEWSFPSVEPPDYLVQLSPGLYEAERARVAARFEEAVQFAEQVFLDEFPRLVSLLAERISGAGEDGQPRVFRDSAVGNLAGFFDRFRSLGVRSNDQLDAPVSEAQRAVRGVGGPGPPRGPRAEPRGGRPAWPGADLSGGDAGGPAPAADPPAVGRLGVCLMQLVVAPGGRVRAIDSEEIALESFGPLGIARASSVEPDREGRWHADLGPVRGPVLGPFARRSEALEAEVAWLVGHWLTLVLLPDTTPSVGGPPPTAPPP